MMHGMLHSQKELAHWTVDVMAPFYRGGYRNFKGAGPRDSI